VLPLPASAGEPGARPLVHPLLAAAGACDVAAARGVAAGEAGGVIRPRASDPFELAAGALLGEQPRSAVEGRPPVRIPDDAERMREVAAILRTWADGFPWVRG
jgi:hypothetical protein